MKERNYDSSDGSGILLSLPFSFLDEGKDGRSPILATADRDDNRLVCPRGLSPPGEVAGLPGKETLLRIDGVGAFDDGCSVDAASVSKNSTHRREKDCRL